MATYPAHRRSIQIAAASGGNPASVSTSTGQVDVSGLTFRGVECDRASITWTSEPTLDEDTTVTTGFESRAPELDTMWASGARLDRARAEVTISGIPIRPYGGGAVAPAIMANAQDMPLVQILSSSLFAYDSGGVALASGGAGANAGQTQLATPLAIGEIVMFDVGGRMEAARTTNMGGGVATFGTYLSTALSGGDPVYRGLNFFSQTGANSGSVGAALAAKISTDAGTQTLTMGRASRLRFYVENGAWNLEATIQFEYVATDISTGGTVADPARTSGAVQRLHGVRPCYSSSAAPHDISAGFSSARSALDEVESDLEVVIEHTLTPAARVDTVVGVSDTTITSTTITATIPAHDIKTNIAKDLRDSVCRQFVLPGAPVNDGSTTANGFALVLSAAYQTASAEVLSIDGELVSQAITVTCGQYGGDAGSETYKNAPFGLFLGGS